MALLFLFLFFVFPSPCFSLGGAMGSIAAVYDSSGIASAVCAITQGPSQLLLCVSWTSPGSPPQVVSLQPAGKPLAGISGGRNLLCGLRSDTWRPLCWDFNPGAGVAATPKRMANQAYSAVAVGSDQVCAVGNGGATSACWRTEVQPPPGRALAAVTAGDGFACGLESVSGALLCWGAAAAASSPVVAAPPNASFVSIYAGASHACGLTSAFNAQCWGDDSYAQLNQPSTSSGGGGGDPLQFLSLALGQRHTCGIDAFSRRAICWGDDSLHQTAAILAIANRDLSFLSITAGDFFTCGVLSVNFSVFCWGGPIFGAAGATLLQFEGLLLPSACTNSGCTAGSFQQPNASICSTPDLHVCTPCRIGCPTPYLQTAQCTPQHDIACSSRSSAASPASTPPASSSSTAPTPIVVVYRQEKRSRMSAGLIVLVAFGCAGVLVGLSAVACCAWAKFHGPAGFALDGSQGRVHNTAGGGSGSATGLQRISTSSVRTVGRGSETGKARAFLVSEMAAATGEFSQENKIATGSFGAVYRGVLSDGTEVAIKRREKSRWGGGSRAAAEEEEEEEGGSGRKEADVDGKESAFESELEFLSRLHHKHLVSLVGYCDEGEERMLVYEYMPNGTLHDHLHGNGGAGAAAALGWRRRMEIALEAARGVEYLHSYAVPPIIHRDIKSSNILLDGAWRARVSDFGLSTEGPSEVDSHVSVMAAGTLGYMDPEYYRLQHLTVKSDVYSFGVVLLELITGCRAIHRRSYGPVNIVDYAVPKMAGGWEGIAAVLDPRAAPPTAGEKAALEKVAALAMACVRLDGKSRPKMAEIVAALEAAVLGGGGEDGGTRHEGRWVGLN